MIQRHRIAWPFLILICVLHFSACSVPVNFYIRNLTEQPTLIEVHLADKDGTLEDYPVLSSPGVDTLYFSFYKDMAPVEGDRKGKSNIYTLKLPPRSTFFVGKGVNFHNGFFDKIVVIDAEGSKTVLDQNNKNILRRGKTQPNRFYAWYDIR